MFQKMLSSILVGSLVLVALVFSTTSFAQATKTAICHATSSESNPYNFLELPPAPLSAHFDENGSPLAGHEQDFFPVDNDCDRSNDGGGPGPNPEPVPEPITMLLFGAGLAGVGYASRRYLKRSKGDDSNEV